MFQLNLSENDSPYELAVTYYEEGYSVVPLQRADKKPPKNLGSWEQYKTERPPREKIDEWFKDRDDLVVAIVCGKFIVVDADTPEAMVWVENNLPVTPFKVITGKGMHFYYNNPQNFTTFATRRTNETPIERLIDIRGEGGLIIAPHNRHANGAIYKPVYLDGWPIHDFTDLPDFTDKEWFQITGVPKEVANTKQNITIPFSLEGVNEGSRNDQAARISGYLISKNVNLDFTKFFLQSWNNQNNPPLPQKEVESVVDNVKRTHDRKNEQAPLFIQASENIVPPKDLYNPPGLLKDMYNFCGDIAQVPQPELSLVAALALASVTCGRLYRTSMNNFSSLFFMCIAKVVKFCGLL